MSSLGMSLMAVSVVLAVVAIEAHEHPSHQGAVLTPVKATRHVALVTPITVDQYSCTKQVHVYERRPKTDRG